jgi:predicted outer membrane protein
MRRAVLVGTVVLVVLASSAFAQPPAVVAGRANPDSVFLIDAAKGGMAEVELGKLGTEKAASEQVKKFAHRMADVKPDEQIVVDTELGEFNVYLWKAETLRGNIPAH